MTITTKTIRNAPKPSKRKYPFFSTFNEQVVLVIGDGVTNDHFEGVIVASEYDDSIGIHSMYFLRRLSEPFFGKIEIEVSE